MSFEVGDRVKVFDEHEDDWFEGTITELYDDGAMVDYETKYYWHVTKVEYSKLKAIMVRRS